MKKAVIKEMDGIGPVLFEPSNRAKRLIISYKPSRGVRVAVPDGMSFRKAQKFFYSNLNLIEKHLVKVKQLKQNYKPRRPKIIEIDVEKALYKLADRLDELAKKHGFNHRCVSFRNQKTRWGSCSSKGNISLNVKLLCLPEELRDYVLLHELVHTKVRNHGNAFWAELDKYLGDAKALRSRLNKHNTLNFKIVHKPDDPPQKPVELPYVPEAVSHKPNAKEKFQLELF